MAREMVTSMCAFKQGQPGKLNNSASSSRRPAWSTTLKPTPWQRTILYMENGLRWMLTLFFNTGLLVNLNLYNKLQKSHFSVFNAMGFNGWERSFCCCWIGSFFSLMTQRWLKWPKTETCNSRNIGGGNQYPHLKGRAGTRILFEELRYTDIVRNPLIRLTHVICVFKPKHAPSKCPCLGHLDIGPLWCTRIRKVRPHQHLQKTKDDGEEKKWWYTLASPGWVSSNLKTKLLSTTIKTPRLQVKHQTLNWPTTRQLLQQSSTYPLHLEEALSREQQLPSSHQRWPGPNYPWTPATLALFPSLLEHKTSLPSHHNFKQHEKNTKIYSPRPCLAKT